MQVEVVMTTVGSEEDACRLARLLVEEKLAACVQVTAIVSTYQWDGVATESEWRLDIKTTPGLRPRLVSWLDEHHPYDLPQILWAAFGATQAYGQWVRAQTAPR